MATIAQMFRLAKCQALIRTATNQQEKRALWERLPVYSAAAGRLDRKEAEMVRSITKHLVGLYRRENVG